MTLEEVFTVGVIAVLAAVSTAAIYIGLLTWMGALYMVRCAACQHLTYSSANHPQDSCLRCRHPIVMHPIHALRHARVSVVNDRLQ